ncbi:hypothetical protein Bca52824_079012 [Brassica carinata]|uniref:Uncharacterized protein n=1 Tax=Brassica carinata TaxID=52824 RepID=A0A8X7PZ04_BRACI|nr:hypothetical protein Bca52824_079012 [Brassica carinata]
MDRRYSRSERRNGKPLLCTNKRPPNSSFIPEGQAIREVNSERVLPITARVEITPTRNIKERLGTSSAGKDGANSGSKDRRSALERLSIQLHQRSSADDGAEDLNPIDRRLWKKQTKQKESPPLNGREEATRNPQQ